MNRYQFEQVTRKMERRYGKIRKGEEDLHAMVLFPMESNVLKIHRIHPESNSICLKEAIFLTLHKVEGYLEEETDEAAGYETAENARLMEALLASFDPFTNTEIHDVLCKEGGMDMNDKDAVIEYFKEPVQCIMRIKDSVDYWERRGGSNGYFIFLDGWMGDRVPRDDVMNYGIMVGKEFASGIANYFP